MPDLTYQLMLDLLLYHNSNLVVGYILQYVFHEINLFTLPAQTIISTHCLIPI